MPQMTSAEIRQSFFDFFREKQHTIVPSSSLLPDSPNLLFTNAGMNQFVPIFLGQQSAPYQPPRAADTQKCIRAGGKHNDLDDVGLDTYHHTFFEMLGNWSFGDYFKREAIGWAWELIVSRWGFPPGRVYATVYCPHMDMARWQRELDACIRTVRHGALVEWTDDAPGATAIERSDRESIEYWAEVFIKADLNPAVHIVPGNKKDNFWMMGETGPCGPCSELHIDLTPNGDTAGSLVNAGDPRCIEIWNLVFIQFNANPDGSFAPLPARHVDTGMGFERVTALIQGTTNFSDFSRPTSNYETDVFRPIFDEIERLSGKKYGSTLPAASIPQAPDISPAGSSVSPQPSGVSPQATDVSPKGSYVFPRPSYGVRGPGEAVGEPREHVGTSREHERTSREHEGGSGEHKSASGDDQIQLDIAFRVIADHIRTLSFAIADGIQPSNEGRGYVLRRILRRAVRYGRTLGFHEPFFYKLVDVLVAAMSGVFPELAAKQQVVRETLRREEESFNRTLDRGIDEFRRCETFVSQQAGDGGKPGSPGSGALSGEEAFRLYDTYGFPLDLTELMARERGLTVDVAGFEKLMDEQRARARGAQKKSTIELAGAGERKPTHFLGYDHDHTGGDVEEVTIANGRAAVVVNNSVCYAEMGGQVGDTGELATSDKRWRIANTQKAGGAWIHVLEADDAPARGEHVTVRVDQPRRRAIERHHTVTHLLHWALHEVVSREAAQKGSYVGPEKLTFDFNNAALTHEQLRDVEKLVNERIIENGAVSWIEMPYQEVKGRPEIMQFFGDKYGDTVRVVQIGGEARALNGYSMELCGGTHVRGTGEIGLFRIVGESAIAAGVRRIEAVAGLNAYEQAKRDQEFIRSIAGKLNSPINDLEKRVESMLAQQKALEKTIKALEQKQAVETARELVGKAQQIGGLPAIIENLGAATGDQLQALAEALKQQQFGGVAVLAGVADGNVALVATVGSGFTAKVQAGKIIQAIAPLVGGKGGGRPDGARGAGKDASKLEAALAHARSMLAS